MANEMALIVRHLAEGPSIEYGCEVVEDLLERFTDWLDSGLITHEEFGVLASSLGRINRELRFMRYKSEDGPTRILRERIILSLRTGGFRAD